MYPLLHFCSVVMHQIHQRKANWPMFTVLIVTTILLLSSTLPINKPQRLHPYKKKGYSVHLCNTEPRSALCFVTGPEPERLFSARGKKVSPLSVFDLRWSKSSNENQTNLPKVSQSRWEMGESSASVKTR